MRELDEMLAGIEIEPPARATAKVAVVVGKALGVRLADDPSVTDVAKAVKYVFGTLGWHIQVFSPLPFKLEVKGDRAMARCLRASSSTDIPWRTRATVATLAVSIVENTRPADLRHLCDPLRECLADSAATASLMSDYREELLARIGVVARLRGYGGIRHWLGTRIAAPSAQNPQLGAGPRTGSFWAGEENEIELGRVGGVALRWPWGGRASALDGLREFI
jgi:hypothetical protein